MDITPLSLQIFFTGLNASFAEAYKTAAPWADRISMRVNSSTDLETYGWRDRMPTFREWIGPRLLQNAPLRSRSVVNRLWEMSEIIPRTRFEDDRLGLYSTMAADMGMQAAKLHDQQLVSLIQSNPTGFDGVPFFGTTHPTDLDTPGSATQSNSLNLALTPSNYSAARAAMRAFKGRDGQPLNTKPSILVVPPSLEEAGMNILNADFFAPSVFGGAAAVGMSDNKNLLKGSAELLVIDELENQPKTWYLLDNTGLVKPLLVQIRNEPEFVYLNNPTDTNVFFDDKYIFGARSRSAYDVTVWFKALRSVGP